MNLDGHVHLLDGADGNGVFYRKLRASGMDGGVIISLPPASFAYLAPPMPARKRLAHLLDWCAVSKTLFPFFWIDPMEADAPRQVSEACEQGVSGFKVITDRFDPGHPKAMRIFGQIARAGRPILFHSGILWDGKPSSLHTRPLLFEALMEVKSLRFALAHIGWPWCEELVAVYGKLLNARVLRKANGAEMFVDATPGTPAIRREAALKLLFKIGYDVQNNVFFGSDCRAGSYNSKWVMDWRKRDLAICRKLKIPQKTIKGLLGANLRRFINGGTPPALKIPRPDSQD